MLFLFLAMVKNILRSVSFTVFFINIFESLKLIIKGNNYTWEEGTISNALIIKYNRLLPYVIIFLSTEEEVKKLCNKNKDISFNELESWYNGYLTAKGTKIYNARSVIKALQNTYCESYWTNTGAMDEVAEYLKYNTLEIRDDVIDMVSGSEIDIIIDEEFRAGQGRVIQTLLFILEEKMIFLL